MTPILTASFEDEAHVDEAVSGLIEHHCAPEEIGVLTSTRDGPRRAPIRLHSGLRTGGLVGMGIGAVLGAAGTVLVLNGILPSPGLDLLVGVPQIAALQGLVTGAAIGGLAGMLIGLGFWTEEAETDPEDLPSTHPIGPITVGVAAAGARADELREVLRHAGAREVRLTDPGDLPRMWDAIQGA